MSQKEVFLGKENKGLYCLQMDPQPVKFSTSRLQSNKRVSSDSVVCLSTAELWHIRLGHLPFDQLKNVGISQFNNNYHGVCQTYPMAKLHRAPFP